MAIRTGPPTTSRGIQKRSHIREYRLRRGPSKNLYPALGDGIRHRPITPGFLGGGRDMGPEESNPDRHAGAWRLLICAALRANGLRVVVKTTGKMPVLIDAAGKETVLERPPTPTANLREQKEIVRLAKEQHAQAIVIECMAVDPELRRVSQETLIRATLAVITNIRRDHLEVIGPDLGTGARTLSDVIPSNGTLITADQRLLS